MSQRAVGERALALDLGMIARRASPSTPAFPDRDDPDERPNRAVAAHGNRGGARAVRSPMVRGALGNVAEIASDGGAMHTAVTLRANRARRMLGRHADE